MPASIGHLVACPVVAGAIALLVSIVPEPRRWQLLNPAVIKQVLTQTAHKLHHRSAYEQGAGTMDLLGAAQLITDYVPHASVLPSSLDLSPCTPHGQWMPGNAESGDGYMWPHCAQPLYHGAMPLLLNLTVLNGVAVRSKVSDPGPSFVAADDQHNRLLSLTFEHAPSLWPWGGTLGVAISVTSDASDFEGLVTGEIRFELEAQGGLHDGTVSELIIPLTVRIVPTPPRSKRLLFDQWHSVNYPPAYLLRDNLAVTDELLDWSGDHLHTNMNDLYMWLRQNGYYVETLSCPFTCFNASEYGALLLIDAEAEYQPLEARKLRHDIIHNGLSLIVLADWYNTIVMRSLKFFDENTRSWWMPVTGGSNVPALNELLSPFGIAFGDAVLRGELTLGDDVGHSSDGDNGDERRIRVGGSSVTVASAAPIARFPAGGYLVRARSLQDEGAKIANLLPFAKVRHEVPMLGLLQPLQPGSGRIAAFGDSECVDSLSSQQGAAPCWWLLKALLNFACEGKRDTSLFPDGLALRTPHRDPEPLPSRPQPAEIAKAVDPKTLPPSPAKARELTRSTLAASCGRR